MRDGVEKKLLLDTGLYLCRLLRCALVEGEAPGPLPDGVTLRGVHRLARRHSVEGVSCYGVLKGDFPDGGELVDKWRGSIDKTLMKQALFDTEREEILREMAQAGLSYLPLKGIRIAGLYPLPGMRSMADNDILYGFVEPDPEGGYRISRERADAISEARDIMTGIMTGRGFEVESLEANHDVYQKKPFYNFEMHRALVPKQDTSFDYYRNPWKRAIPAEGCEYEYIFSPEDDYIYNIAHMYMHYDIAGCGLRSIADLYVMHRSFGDSFDHGYVRGELESLGLSKFHHKIFELMRALFSENGELTEEQSEMLLFILEAGTFGSYESHFDRKMKKIEDSGGRGMKAKLAYLKNRIVVPPEVCKRKYPAFYNKPYLAPVLLVYRLGKGIVGGSGRLWRELKRLVKHK